MSRIDGRSSARSQVKGSERRKARPQRQRPSVLLEALERRVLLSSTIYDPNRLPLDPSFGNAGIVTGYSGPMIVQSDGKILVDQNGAGKIVRLNADGSLDPTFNSAGAVDTWGPDYAAQSDGKHLILKDGVLTRYNPDGSIDASFGNSGSISSFYVNPTYMSFIPQAITMQGDKVVVAGEAVLDPHTDWTFSGKGPYAVERLNPDGSQDTAYGMHICVASDADPATVRRVRVSPDGRILVAGDDTEWQMGIVGSR